MAFYKIKHIIIGITISFLSILFLFPNHLNTRRINEVIRDTIYIDKPYKVEVIKEVEVPKIVRVYHTDTILREKLVKDTLITFLEITPKQAHIHTLTPSGKPSINTYPIEDYTQLQINHKGQIKRRRKKRFWKSVERVGLFVSGVLLGKSI